MSDTKNALETPPKFHRRVYYDKVVKSFIKNRGLKCYMEILSEFANRVHAMTGHTVTNDKITPFIEYYVNHRGLKIDQGVIYTPNMPSKPLFGKFFPLLAFIANLDKKKTGWSLPFVWRRALNSGFDLR